MSTSETTAKILYEEVTVGSCVQTYPKACSFHLWDSYLPTLLVFPGESKFFIKSPSLFVRGLNLPDKMELLRILMV